MHFRFLLFVCLCGICGICGKRPKEVETKSLACYFMPWPLKSSACVGFASSQKNKALSGGHTNGSETGKPRWAMVTWCHDTPSLVPKQRFDQIDLS